MIDRYTNIKTNISKNPGSSSGSHESIWPYYSNKKITVLYPTFFPTVKFVTFSMHPLLKTL
jgi:hypothetical protein